LDSRLALSRTTGPVLDPVFSLRRRVKLAPGETTRIAFVSGAAETRDAAIAIAERLCDFEAIEQAFLGAKVRAERELKELDVTPETIALSTRLAAAVAFTNSSLRDLNAVAANRLGQSGLWPHGISGDLPIVLARVAQQSDEPLVRELVRWRSYARRR